MSTILREAKGKPTGGQFREHQRADAPISLASNGFLATGEQPINDRFPFPQANVLEKVLCVVDAVDAGANTAEAVAETLSVTAREGAYYADAAGYLGFVDTIDGAEVKTYGLTHLGERLQDADAARRVEAIRDVVARVDAVQVHAEYGEDGVRELLEETTGLGDSTVTRRAATIAAWYDALGHTTELTEAVEREHSDAGDRAIAAAIRATVARQERLAAAAKAAERVAAICEQCFMELPLSGICGNC